MGGYEVPNMYQSDLQRETIHDQKQLFVTDL